MVSNMQILLVVGLIAGLAQTGFAHMCYVCESDGINEKNTCGVNFQPENAMRMDCSKTVMPRFLQSTLGIRNSTGCMKTIREHHSSVKIISRGCFYGDIKDTSRGCSQLDINQGRLISCDVCASDYCNGSTAVTSMSILAFISMYLLRHFCF